MHGLLLAHKRAAVRLAAEDEIAHLKTRGMAADGHHSNASLSASAASRMLSSEAKM